MNPFTFPTLRCTLEYFCLSCGQRYPADELHYACPQCGGVFLLQNADFNALKSRSGEHWRALFDARSAAKRTSLRGIFRFYELIAPMLEEEDILYLGEGNTPVVDAPPALASAVGCAFGFKNEGQNPSASFKDRGMACAFSHLRSLVRRHGWDEVLTVCASTGDTSAAAALYAAYAGAPIKSVVLLPHGKVTPQQLSQPLGSGAVVLELPGVFDDCMKVVEYLAEHYRVALLNSKNAWRILGQESYAYEAAQWFDWDVGNICLFVPVGNAGNITAIMSGFLKLRALNIIDALPRIFGVQSAHADPVCRYYEQEPDKRAFAPVTVQPSVAQAAMIGNPVSFPRVRHLAERYCLLGGPDAFQVIRVQEQEIMDSMILANRHGHIACTQGGECLAGLRRALREKRLSGQEYALLDATAHALKFSGFQDMYLSGSLPPEYGVQPRPELANAPHLLLSPEQKNAIPEAEFTRRASERIADRLHLKKRA